MVAPVRDLGNKFFLSSSTITHSQQPLNLPTVLPSMYIGMAILLGKIPDNYDEVRGRTISPQPHSSRAFSMSSTKSLVDYHERMEYNNMLNNDIDMNDNSEGSGLSYKICHKLHSACISTTSRPIFTNQVVLESPK